jgi:cephalosporin-C deacetylase-like acetyl esterase
LRISPCPSSISSRKQRKRETVKFLEYIEANRESRLVTWALQQTRKFAVLVRCQQQSTTGTAESKSLPNRSSTKWIAKAKKI